MLPNSRFITIVVSLVCAVLMLPMTSLAAPAQTYPAQAFIYREPGPSQDSILYADGSHITLDTGSVTWPMIGSDLSQTTPAAFREAMTRARQHTAASRAVIISSTNSRGLSITFSATSPPPGATAALQAIANYIGGLFSDPVSITITIGFESMGPGILGGTSSSYANSVTYTNTRSGLVSGMDADDTMQTYLPTGSTIPIRYNIASGTATSETRCYFTVANYRATIGTVSGNAADMSINTDYTWDYDPSNGVSGFCFRSVVAHEVGHVLGFTSGADFRTNDIEALDLYRFQRSDGTGDYNPDTIPEFQTTARLCWLDETGSSDDDCNSDLISVEYRMSDGTPYQASHFSQGNVDAIMQPAVSEGTTFYPNYYRIPDRTMLDAIGWDYVAGTGYSLQIQINPVGAGYVTKDPDQSLYYPGDVVTLTAYGNSGYTFSSWSGSVSGTQNPITLTMNGNKTVTANFGGAPPNTPQTPDGQAFGFRGIEYTYTSKTSDPNGDDVYYMWDWGDGSTMTWVGPYHSGDSVSTPHTFQISGSFNVRVKAKDTSNAESDWSPSLPVTMPLIDPAIGHQGPFLTLLLRLLHLLWSAAFV